MKITFVLPDIGISGGVRSTFELANRLCGRGHHVSIVYPQPPRPKARWHSPRYLLKRILFGNHREAEGNGNLGWFDLKANLMAVPTLAEEHIPTADVIVATWWANAYDVDSYGADKGRKFYFIRSYEVWGGPEDLVDKTYTLPLRKIAVSAFLKKMIEEKFGVHVLGPLPNGINFELFYRERADFGAHNPKRVGMLYRNQKIKGMKDGLEAFLMARQKHPGIRFVLFGEEPADGDMEVIKTMDNVEFHKLPYKEDLRKIYNSLDIFIFSSHYEGYANTPAEAMACGAACVVTEVGGVLDYAIPHKTALISLPRNPKDLAGNVIRLLDCEQERMQIAQRGHDRIRKFTWDKTVAELEKIFLEYVSG